MSARTCRTLFASVLGIAWCIPAAFAQTALPALPGVPQQAPPAPKQIDIGVAAAPLSQQERDDLAEAIAKHNYKAEKAVIDRALAEHPASRELLIMAGRIAYLERQPVDVVASLQAADKIKPLDEDDRVSLAVAEQSAGQAAAAEAELAKLIKDFPKNARYPYLLGRMQQQDQHYESAVVSFRKALALDANLIHAYEDLGQTQETLGLLDDAKKTYEEGARRNRQQKKPWEWSPVDLGALLLKDGDVDEAEKLFHEGLLYNFRFGWAHYYLARVAEKRGKRELALTEYQTAVVDTPSLRQAWLALGREYTRLGQKAEADRCLAIFKKLEEQQTSKTAKSPTP